MRSFLDADSYVSIDLARETSSKSESVSDNRTRDVNLLLIQPAPEKYSPWRILRRKVCFEQSKLKVGIREVVNMENFT